MGINVNYNLKRCYMRDSDFTIIAINDNIYK